MWGPLGKNRSECDALRESLELIITLEDLPSGPQEHLKSCAECRTALDDLLLSRKLLRTLGSHRAAPTSSFGSRVMAAIAAREAELRRTLDIWSVMPRLAARVAWVSALALLLAGAWLYRAPRATTVRYNGGSSAESLFDSSPVSYGSDDILVTRMEQQ